MTVVHKGLKGAWIVLKVFTVATIAFYPEFVVNFVVQASGVLQGVLWGPLAELIVGITSFILMKGLSFQPVYLQLVGGALLVYLLYTGYGQLKAYRKSRRLWWKKSLSDSLKDSENSEYKDIEPSDWLVLTIALAVGLPGVWAFLEVATQPDGQVALGTWLFLGVITLGAIGNFEINPLQIVREAKVSHRKKKKSRREQPDRLRSIIHRLQLTDVKPEDIDVNDLRSLDHLCIDADARNELKRAIRQTEPRWHEEMQTLQELLKPYRITNVRPEDIDLSDEAHFDALPLKPYEHHALKQAIRVRYGIWPNENSWGARLRRMVGWCIALAAALGVSVGASEIIMGAPLKADHIYGLAFLSLLICCSLPPLIKVIGRAWDDFLALGVRTFVLFITFIVMALIAAD